MSEPFFEDGWLTVFGGDCRAVMAAMPAESVDCVVTSPPYWQLRDYGMAEQVGMELTPAEYVAAMVGVFREIRRVLRPDGVAWLNLGDTYAASGKGGGGSRGDRKNWRSIAGRSGWRSPPAGYKPKDITLAPFQVAHALRQDGWYLRQVVVWSKPQSPEPARLDRPSSSHEYVFLLSRSEHYRTRNPGPTADWWFRSVWELRTDADASHQAMMPTELAARCIRTSTSAGDVVLDPFAGSGTVGRAAQSLSRRAVLIDLNPDYVTQALTANAAIPLGLDAA